MRSHLKPVKLNQLLFNATAPCLSFYVPDEASFASLHQRLEQRLDHFPELKLIYQRELHAITEILKRHPTEPCGFYLSSNQRGYLPLDHDTDANFYIGQNFFLGPVLEELFTNPEYALVLLSENEMGLYRGDGQQIELLERHEFSHIRGPQTIYGQTSIVSPSQRRGLKDFALRLHQSSMLTRMPIVIAGSPELVEYFSRSFKHPFGVVTLKESGHYTAMTCPQLLKELPRFRSEVVEHYTENLKLRFKTLVRTGRILSDLQLIVRAIPEGKVTRILMPERRRLWGKLDFSKGQVDIMGLHEVDGSVDIMNELAEAVIRHGGKIQFLPQHFFPHGSYAMVILRGDSRAHAPVFRVATQSW